MNKGVFILYMVCFCTYLLFTRQPDYFDGVKVPARIAQQTDSVSGKPVWKAIYHTGLKQYAVDAAYPLRSLKVGDQVTVIYESGTPEKGAVYSWWGYGITWGELLASVILCIGLFQIAVAVTSNPSPESLIEQLEAESRAGEKKRKYKD